MDSGRHPGITCVEPEGACYVSQRILILRQVEWSKQVIKEFRRFCMYLMKPRHVSSVMGDAFGEPACVRSLCELVWEISRKPGGVCGKEALYKLK